MRRATTWQRGSRITYVEFLSTLSLRRATTDMRHRLIELGNFYPRSPCGERPTQKKNQPDKPHISIHALLAESDSSRATETGKTPYFYPRSPCGERRGLPAIKCPKTTISIHALLAESDITIDGHTLPITSFLSTLSLRRATSPVVAVSSLTVYFYPRSPCGERQKLILQFLSLLRISIHALLAESDSIDNSEISDNLTFLSTLSLRRATLDFGRG